MQVFGFMMSKNASVWVYDVKKCKCFGLWRQKTVLPEKINVFFYFFLKWEFNDIVQQTNQIRMRKFSVKCGKVKCRNSFCITFTINPSLTQNGLSEE